MRSPIWRKPMWHVVLFVVLSGLTLHNAWAQQPVVPSVGFKEVVQDGVTIGIWYPSDGPVNRATLGPFGVSYSDNGNPLDGLFPIVMISHGIGGQYRNHHLTAVRLVRDGNVVIAPTHSRDLSLSRRAVIARMEYRHHDLTAALVAVNKDPLLSRIIDRLTVKAVGYSLGSASILIAAGARLETKKLEDHCDTYMEQDRNFCSWVTPGLWRSVWEWLIEDEDTRNGEYSSSTPLISGDIVLVAPVGQGLDLTAVNAGDSKIQVLALGDDQEVVPEFHAKASMTKIDFDKINYIEYPSTHHYAFIAPFPKWLTDKEDIPVAKDPPGFNRALFLERINNDIALFLSP